MRDSLTSDNSRDFIQRYVGTFGWYLDDEKKERVLVYVAGVANNQVRFTNARGAEYFAKADAGVQFEFIPVNKGWFNTTVGLYYLERHPERQWHRGIHPNNTKAFRGNLLPQPVNFVTISTVFNHGVPLAEAFAKFKSDAAYGVALSNHFAIINADVYLFRYKIGVYDKVSGVIKLKEKLVLQELSDVIKRNRIGIEVVCE